MAGGSVQLQLMGPLTLTRGGEAIALPPSKKTRALLAYLAIVGKPERRERLCELFWDLPDDPRGALRWSLTKLRPLVDEAVRADREWVELTLSDAAVDFRRLRALVQSGLPAASVADLEGALGAGDLLEGLELPRCEAFQAWRVAHQEDARRWRAAALEELTRRDLAAEARIAHARTWTSVATEDPQAWRRLIELLEAAGRTREADEQRAVAARAGHGLSRKAKTQPSGPAVEVRFCTASDGASIAYSIQGEGPPLVKTANWMTHLERDASGPIWRHWIDEFTTGRSLLRYDQRGNGLSDWDVTFTEAAFLDDLEQVVDAAGLERFDLLGLSQGASLAIAYAAKHPDRVRKIVLLGAYARGWALQSKPELIARREAMLTLTRTGWDEDNPAFRQLFTSLFIPDADPETQAWFNTTQKMSTSGENAYAIQRCGADLNLERLMPKVKAPTLVAHRREDAVVPFEAGREVARLIPGARFLPLEGRNHLLLEDEPAWRQFADTARAFLDS